MLKQSNTNFICIILSTLTSKFTVAQTKMFKDWYLRSVARSSVDTLFLYYSRDLHCDELISGLCANMLFRIEFEL